MALSKGYYERRAKARKRWDVKPLPIQEKWNRDHEGMDPNDLEGMIAISRGVYWEDTYVEVLWYLVAEIQYGVAKEDSAHIWRIRDGEERWDALVEDMRQMPSGAFVDRED